MFPSPLEMSAAAEEFGGANICSPFLLSSKSGGAAHFCSGDEIDVRLGMLGNVNFHWD